MFVNHIYQPWPPTFVLTRLVSYIIRQAMGVDYVCGPGLWIIFMDQAYQSGPWTMFTYQDINLIGQVGGLGSLTWLVNLVSKPGP